MSIYTDLRDVVNQAANALRDDANKHQFTTADVADWIQLHRPDDWPRFEPSFQANYSTLTRDPECVVERVPGRFLYQIGEGLEGDEGLAEDHGEGFEAVEAEQEVDAEILKTQRETKLYDLVRVWLESRGYQAATTATLRRGGVWGNPDVTGIRVDELLLGQVTFECASVEAKLSSDSWKYWFFEAVSHKRFVHRAWFGFAVGTDNPSLDGLKDAEKMCEYAERYRVGILVVFISKDHYQQLRHGDATSLKLSTDDARVEILWPAFYEPVQAPALNEFLTEVLQLKSLSALRQFGA